MTCRATALAFCMMTAVSAATLTIDGRANIFGAGHPGDLTPAPNGGGGGVAAPSFSFSAGAGQVLTFSSVTGTLSCCSGSGPNGPDGGTSASGSTDILSYNGISGIIHNERTMFLVGVFLSGAEPADPAPARLDFSAAGLGTAFTTLSPLLNQTFFIGDGLTGTGSGSVQQFLVPVGATRLYLGFADSYDFGNPSNPPGYYDDNTGSVDATFSVSGVPEPGTFALGGIALAAATLLRRRR